MRASLAIAVAAAIVLPGCQGASDNSAGSRDSGQSQARLSVDGDDVTFDAAAELAKAANTQADDVQLDALRDGRLTFAEYEMAVANMVACSRNAGIPVVDLGVQDDPRGIPLAQYAVPVSVEGMTEDEVRDAADSCYQKHAATLDAMWQLGHDPTSDPATLERQVTDLAECLADNGVRVNPASVITEQQDELVQRAIDLSSEGGPDCLVEAGFR